MCRGYYLGMEHQPRTIKLDTAETTRPVQSALELDLAGIAESAFAEKEEGLKVVEGLAFEDGEVLELKDGRKLLIKVEKDTYIVSLIEKDGTSTKKFWPTEEDIIKAVSEPARIDFWKRVYTLPEYTLVTLIENGKEYEVLKSMPNGDLSLLDPHYPKNPPLNTKIDAVATMYIPDGKGGQRRATRADRIREEDEESERNKVVN